MTKTRSASSYLLWINWFASCCHYYYMPLLSKKLLEVQIFLLVSCKWICTFLIIRCFTAFCCKEDLWFFQLVRGLYIWFTNHLNLVQFQMIRLFHWGSSCSIIGVWLWRSFGKTKLLAYVFAFNKFRVVRRFSWPSLLLRFLEVFQDFCVNVKLKYVFH